MIHSNDSVDHGEAEQKVKDLLYNIISMIVSNPDYVIIESRLDDIGIFIQLSVHTDDMPFVIGKDGQFAKALRVILRSLGRKFCVPISLRLDPEKPKYI